ncbi:hypothetical protein GSI_08575 [Ganoderma sinense ZZ0214-1]|uniref:Uncharacterized protein n=1 Tax=Ganoderma sinense ZZ0214-1 TaxID=1077348 RepID=A0A2G8S467_9APHY|nr:hypothetical protein GSI_08575 [Ganoderma sinense ZZ0214-1]
MDPDRSVTASREEIFQCAMPCRLATTDGSVTPALELLCCLRRWRLDRWERGGESGVEKPFVNYDFSNAASCVDPESDMAGVGHLSPRATRGMWSPALNPMTEAQSG